MGKKKKSLRGFDILLLIFLFLSIVIFLFVYLNYKTLIYPPSHRSQPSPKKYVEEKFFQLNFSQSKPEVIEHGSRDKHQVALTFDADMTQAMYLLLQRGIVKSWYNKPIKDTLDREQVKATVFLGGLWTKAYPKESQDLANDPLIEIGNHSYSHPAFTANCYRLPVINNDQDKDEVESAQNIIIKTTGITPKYFRFPGGCYDNIDLQTITKLGLKIVHWDVVAGDGFSKDAKDIINRVEPRVQNGSIIVFHIHDGPFAPKTNDALLKIIPDLKKKGYTFVTISEMLSN